MENRNNRKRVYEGKILNIELDQVTLPNGHQIELEMIHHPGAAAVVPLLEDGNVVLIYQYRYAAGGYIYEIPAGKLDPDEDPVECAKRELEEETGYTAGRYQKLVSFLTTPGFCDEIIHVYLAQSLIQGEQNLEASEVLEVKKVPFKKSLEMIEQGLIMDGKSIIGLQSAYLLLNKGGAFESGNM
ncbi:MAG: NUDIX domain-containing protein [Nitrospiria bacterium]